MKLPLALAAIILSSTSKQVDATPPTTLDLSPLRVTRAEVARREARLRPIFEYYGNTNVAQMLNTLEGLYGINVYHHIAGVQWPASALSNKKGIMAAAVQQSISWRSRAPVFAQSRYDSWGNRTYSPLEEIKIQRTRWGGHHYETMVSKFNALVSSYCHLTNSLNLTSGMSLSILDLKDMRDRLDYNRVTKQDQIVLDSQATCDENLLLGRTAGRLLDQVPEEELGFAQKVTLGEGRPLLSLVKGKGSSAPIYTSSPFMLQSEMTSNSRLSMQGFDPLRFLSLGLLSDPFRGFSTKEFSLYSTLTNPAIKTPQLYRLLATLSRLQFKALDATVVFVNSTLEVAGGYKRWAVIYPGFSTVAPIPQPIVYISASATDQDLEELLLQEAPLIATYNKLFDAKLLPSASRIQRALERFSKTNPELAALIQRTGRYNAEQGARRAFLALSYGILHSAGALHQGTGALVRETVRRFDNTVDNIGNAIYDILDDETYESTLTVAGPYGLIRFSERITE